MLKGDEYHDTALERIKFNEYLLCWIQRTWHSLTPGIGASDVPQLMLATVSMTFLHCHAAESLLALNKVHAVIAVHHIFTKNFLDTFLLKRGFVMLYPPGSGFTLLTFP